jgi:hypothetical protein
MSVSRADAKAMGCKVFPTKTTFVTKAGAQTTSTGTTTCSFDRGSVKRMCTTETRTLPTAEAGTSNAQTTSIQSTARFSSFADVLRGRPSMTTNTGDRCSSEASYVYDAQGRETSCTTRANGGAGCAGFADTCNAWDEQGRILRCSESISVNGMTGMFALSVLYDDRAHTVTTRYAVVSGEFGGSTTVQRYDADDFLVSLEDRSVGTTPIVTTYDNVATETVCP